MGVLAVQKALNALQVPGTPLAEDGASGPKTTAAIKAFQSMHGLSADGVVGPMTIAALQAALAGAPAPALAQPALAPQQQAIVAFVVNSLLTAQRAMNVLRIPGTPLAEDGQGGPKTSAALKAFQTAAHISADGAFGPQTAAALQAALARGYV
jgi:peptidoglycan hydrolase-like protein with peptidoglycan-binding domain